MNMNGRVVPSPTSRLPRVTLELAIKQVIVDVTTDVLNQLLILQTSFIKVRIVFHYKVDTSLIQMYVLAWKWTERVVERLQDGTSSGKTVLILEEDEEETADLTHSL